MSLWAIWLLLTLVLFVPYYLLFKGVDLWRKRNKPQAPTLEQMTAMTTADLRRLYEEDDN